MEAALTDAGNTEWTCYGDRTRANGTGIGTGKSNTDAIIANCGEFSAANIAANYKWPNGQTGGFLPSRDELNELYKHKDVVGGFANDYYWSSSENGSSSAWLQGFYSGFQNYYDKSNTL